MSEREKDSEGGVSGWVKTKKPVPLTGQEVDETSERGYTPPQFEAGTHTHTQAYIGSASLACVLLAAIKALSFSTSTTLLSSAL